MGKQEEDSRKRTKRNQLRKIILETVKVAGIISVALVAPNAVGAMVKLGILPSPRQKDVVRRSSYRMVKAGLMEWKDRKLRLTQKGERALRAMSLTQFADKKPRRWDGKWRVLIFDIPERRRGLRIKLRLTLQSIGFVRLQDSVWVYPYDCEEFITLLKADFHVGNDLLYLIVDSIEHDSFLRKHFKL